MKNAPLSLLLVIFAFFSCSDETTIYKDELRDDFAVEENEAVLLNSLSYENSGVLDILEEEQISGKTSKGNEQAGDYPLTLVAEISAPSYTGAENLGATHIAIQDEYAYVSYNTVEDGFAGGIDIVNIADPNRPRLTGRLYFSNADVNALTYDNGYVYAVGGFDSEKSTRTDFNSFIGKIKVENGQFNLSGGIPFGFQEGFNATDVKVNGDNIYVTSGGDGFITAYSKNDLTTLYDAPFQDLRSMAFSSNEITILDASEGVKKLDTDFNVMQTIAISSDFGDFAKRTIAVQNNMLVVSEGTNGAGVYDLNSGSLIKRLPILIDPDGVASQNIVTNAVSINEDIILMANGGAGLSLSEGQENNPDLVGIIELNGSINFVESKGDYIFAASGKKGFQIIKLNRPDSSLEAACASAPSYSGSSNLNVNSGNSLAYSGSKRFSTINNGGELLLCGSWTVSNGINMNADSVLEIKGTMVVGRNRRRRNINVNSGAILKIEGDLIIYGDLNLNDGATIEFIGDASSANIFGNVNKSRNAQVLGTFDDVRNKF